MKNNLSYRVDVLEKCQQHIEENLELILTNHLPHIKEDIAGLKTEMRYTTILNAGVIILGLFISRMIK